jgi:Flp pilus assembly protein TadD
LKKIVFIVIAVLLMAGCVVNRYHSDFEFANRLVQEGLWQEAVFRLQKARADGNESAALHNNLAVALESLGRFEEAGHEYEAALKLAPGNEQIQSNFDKFKKNQRKDNDEKK